MNEIDLIFKSYKNIAVVGLSPDSSRASNGVAKYLIAEGFNIVGVRPGGTEILGKPCYPTLSDIPEPLEIVDVFRNSDAVPEIVDEAIKNKAKVIWLQEGVVHPEAEKKAKDAGLIVISDRCILKDHRVWKSNR